MNPKIAIYLRAATESQNEDAMARQCHAVAAYVLKHGGSIQDIFVDRDGSGMGPHGVAFTDMLAGCQKKMFEVLIVSDLSRISRDLVKLTTALKTFNALGVRVIGVTDGYDSARTSGPLSPKLTHKWLDFQITPRVRAQRQTLRQSK